MSRVEKENLSHVPVTVFRVNLIDSRTAKQFTEANHYSGSCPNGIINLGLFYDDTLIGAAIFGQVIGRYQASKYYPKDPKSLVELRRLSCIDNTRKNTESYFLGKCFKFMRRNSDYKAILSLADSNYGHEGIIYRATNFKYLGETTRDGHPRIFIDGKECHPRHLYDKHGTSGKMALKKIYGDRVTFVDKKPKHVYILELYR